MSRNYPVTKEYQIFSIDSLNQSTKLITFSGRLDFEPGQFIEVRIPGFGEAPFAPTSSPSNHKEWQICVRQAGTVTDQIHRLRIGDKVKVKGPLGHGWPAKSLKNKQVVMVAGGLGLIPLRPLVLSLVESRHHQHLQLFYGSRRPEELLFKKDLESWRDCVACHLTVDKECFDWSGETGFVTDCLKEAELEPSNTIALICGPPIMFTNAIEVLREKNFADEQIYVSLERKMQCGIGKCQHCAIGPYYVCKDGPVFNLKDIAKLRDVF